MKNILLLLISGLFFLKANSQSWQEVGSVANALNANDIINSVIADKQGNIYAAGGFTDTNGGVYVAKWNGTTWSELGTGANALNANNQILTLALDKSGNLYAAGLFTDSVTSNKGHQYVAKWDGNSWSQLGVGTQALNANAQINTLSSDSVGNIFAAGDFTDSVVWKWNGSRYIAKWNGTNWAELEGPIPSLKARGTIGTINSLITDNIGQVYAAGSLYDSLLSSYFVTRFNGTNWTYMGSAPVCVDFTVPIKSLVIDSNSTIYASGNEYFTNVSNTIVTQLKTLSCSRVGAIFFNNEIFASAIDKNKNLYVAGRFTDSTTSLLGNPYVAKWDGTTWSELGTGANALKPNNSIISITTDTANNVYAAGYFYNSSNKYYVGKYTQPAAGINNLTNNAANDLKVYPNPTTNQLTVSGIQFSGNTKIEIENILGQVMVSLSNHLTTANCQLTTANLPSGIYILKATDEKGFVHTAKFVKE